LEESYKQDYGDITKYLTKKNYRKHGDSTFFYFNTDLQHYRDRSGSYYNDKYQYKFRKHSNLIRGGDGDDLIAARYFSSALPIDGLNFSLYTITRQKKPLSTFSYKLSDSFDLDEQFWMNCTVDGGNGSNIGLLQYDDLDAWINLPTKYKHKLDNLDARVREPIVLYLYRVLFQANWTKIQSSYTIDKQNLSETSNLLFSDYYGNFYPIDVSTTLVDNDKEEVLLFDYPLMVGLIILFSLLFIIIVLIIVILLTKDQPCNRTLRRGVTRRFNYFTACASVPIRGIKRTVTRQFGFLAPCPTGPTTTLKRGQDSQELMDQSDERSVEQSNDRSVDQSNDRSVDQSNDISRDVSKDVSKDVSVDQSNDKSVDQSNDISRDESKDVSKDISRDVSKDESNDISKDRNDKSRDVSNDSWWKTVY